MLEDAQIDFAIALAEEILGEFAGQAIRLEDLELLESRHLVIRCQVLTPTPLLSGTVILKQLAARGAGSQRFLNEWATLAFLSRLDSGTAPRVYGSHRDQRLVIIEDLGDVPSVQDLLNGTATGAARRALLDWGTLLGDLQIATRTQAPAYAAAQAALGAATPVSDASRALVEMAPALHEAWAALGVRVPTGFDDALARLSAALIDPDSSWRALVHFDAGMHNVLLVNEGVKLIDFEFARYGHGLIDVVGSRMSFPTAYRGRRLPPAESAALEGAYRRRSAAVNPLAADDTLFETAAAQACAHWAVAKFHRFWHLYLRQRLRQGPGFDAQRIERLGAPDYARRMIYTYLTCFAENAAGDKALDPLVELLDQVAAALLQRWPELEPWPFYPAFGGDEE